MINFNKKSYNILAVVPARAGSKGVKDKNIQKVNNIPLLGYTGIFLKKNKLIDKAICSTDSSKYAKIANNYHLETPFLRPKNISGDLVGDVEDLKHSLIQSEKIYKIKFHYIIMFQPTSPIRKQIDVNNGLKHMLKKKYDSVWSISNTDLKNHPDKQLIIKKNKLHFFSINGSKIIARQQLVKTYQRNGVFYIVNRNLLMRNSLINSNTGFYIINDKIVNIDTMEDLKFFANSLKN